MTAKQAGQQATASHSFEDLERASAAEMERTAAVLDEAEACWQLWSAVVEQAVADFQWLKENGGQRLGRHRRNKRRAILEHDPEEFLAGPRFDAVCLLLGLAPDAVLRAQGIERPSFDRSEAA